MKLCLGVRVARLVGECKEISRGIYHCEAVDAFKYSPLIHLFFKRCCQETIESVLRRNNTFPFFFISM